MTTDERAWRIGRLAAAPALALWIVGGVYGAVLWHAFVIVPTALTAPAAVFGACVTVESAVARRLRSRHGRVSPRVLDRRRVHPRRPRLWHAGVEMPILRRRGARSAGNGSVDLERALELRASDRVRGTDSLWVRLDDDHSVRFERHDVSGDADAVWVYEAGDVLAMREALGIAIHEGLLHALAARWSGERSFELERVLAGADVPRRIELA